jgi:ATP-dependent exoDNAse (exonuclease V) beta subunit
LNSPALTAQQQEAVAARGNVLVVAGAGAGKTRTLVDRCLAWLLDERNQGSVDEILMVTFTQAAAAEMRKRLRDGLEQAQTSSARLAEQLALLETAHICTLHSFCFELVSEHFYELGLDPQLTVLSNEESHVLARRTLDGVLEAVYDSEQPADLAIQRLIQATGGDWDQPVRDLIGRLHEYAQTLRDPAGWFAAQEAGFRTEEPEQWRAWLMAELKHWRASWLPLLQRQPPANKNAQRCAAALQGRGDNPARAQCAAALALIGEIDQSWPRPKGPWRDPIKDFFDEAEFLLSICDVSAETDPLAEDWNWTRPSMLALLDATRRFGAAFAQAKRNAGSIDFQDLEQFALRLLWDKDGPSAIARQWRRKLRLIFVDEFQDINAAQEAFQTWPSLPYWLARRRQKREMLGEEMRLLYVALTRAEHRLILAGTASGKSIGEKWPKRAQAGTGPAEILASASYLDWPGSWPPGVADLENSGQNAFFTWRLYDDDHPWLAQPGAATADAAGTAGEPDLSPQARDRLDWRYPLGGDSAIPAKAAVSDLRREMAGADEEEAPPIFIVDKSSRPADGALTAAEIGSAHHKFLEQVGLERAHTVEGLREEAARLRRGNLLTPEQCACLDLEDLAAFWQSEPGRLLLDRLPDLRRELAFTARLDAAELARLGAAEFAPASAGEFVVVQGVIDLAAILPGEIWLLDFKTDHFPAGELNEKIKLYRPQIELYSAAISRIQRRPVTRRWLHFLAHRHTASV